MRDWEAFLIRSITRAKPSNYKCPSLSEEARKQHKQAFEKWFNDNFVFIPEERRLPAIYKGVIRLYTHENPPAELKPYLCKDNFDVKFVEKYLKATDSKDKELIRFLKKSPFREKLTFSVVYNFAMWAKYGIKSSDLGINATISMTSKYRNAYKAFALAYLANFSRSLFRFLIEVL